MSTAQKSINTFPNMTMLGLRQILIRVLPYLCRQVFLSHSVEKNCLKIFFTDQLNRQRDAFAFGGSQVERSHREEGKNGQRKVYFRV